MRNIEVGQCREAVLRINLVYEPKEIAERGHIPTVRNVYMENVTCQKSKYGVLLNGLDDYDNIYNINIKNCSFNGVTGEIPPATGKLAKAAGASLITYRFEGGFLSQPRFSVKARKGKITGHLVHIYKPEELKTMSDEQMNEAIKRDLYEDAYAVQDEKMIPYYPLGVYKDRSAGIIPGAKEEA